MARILVTGTFALDYIAKYDKAFTDLPNFHGINLSITLPGLRRSFGGCAVNIAVGLRKLGHAVTPFALVGNSPDHAYLDHLRSLDLDLSGLSRCEDYELSSSCWIVTDSENNQFTQFYPGPAADESFSARFKSYFNAHQPFDFVVVAPDVARNMLTVVDACNKSGLPCLVDPGQCALDFEDTDLVELFRRTKLLVLNRFEYEDLKKRAAERLSDVDTIIRTRGEDGAELLQNGQISKIPAVKPANVVDPTGCGDAFRVGLVHAYLGGARWAEAIKVGTTLASVAIEHQATQTYTVDHLSVRFKRAFGYASDYLADTYEVAASD